MCSGARQKIPPFGLIVLAVFGSAAGVGLLLAVAIGRGAPAHAAGLLLTTCTSLFQGRRRRGLAYAAFPPLPARPRGCWARCSNAVEDDPRAARPAPARSFERSRAGRERRGSRLVGSGRHSRLRRADRVDPRAVSPARASHPRDLETLTQSELQAVLAHEANHLRRRDPLRLLGAEVASSALVIFPLVGELARHFVVATELAADRAAVAAVGRRALAAGLLNFIDTPRQFAVPCLALESMSDERIGALVHPRRLRPLGRPEPRSRSCERAERGRDRGHALGAFRATADALSAL